MYVCCPNGPFGYCQTVSPSGALTTAKGLPIFASTSPIEAPDGTDGVIIAAQPTSASTASHALQKRSGTFIARLLRGESGCIVARGIGCRPPPGQNPVPPPVPQLIGW